MSRIPRYSTILITIGEIDCRPHEGIMKAFNKGLASSIYEIMINTVDSYINYIAEVAGAYHHKLVVSGVPAIHRPLNDLSGNERIRFVNLVSAFNHYLRESSKQHCFDFLDVYTLTNRGDGYADGQWHLDTVHLIPRAITKAFDFHCIYHDAPS